MTPLATRRTLFASLALIAGALAVTGARAARARRASRFDEIDVGRINVREPDGTLRLAISSTAASPGIIVAGREYPHPSRKTAGMIFYNEEGTENGGLIFDGKLVDGKPTSSGSLTFDRWQQDQVVQIIATEDGSARRSGIIINDQPDGPLAFDVLPAIMKLPPGEREAAASRANAGTTQRGFFGRAADGSVQLALRDGSGKTRLMLRVEANGRAVIEFLDANDEVRRTITP